MYNFCNQSDDSLANLSAAGFFERERRIMAKIKTFPVPEILEYSKVDTIKSYRTLHGCSLLEAKTIVDFYWNKD